MSTKIFLDSDATENLILKMWITADALYDHAVVTYSRMARVDWESATKDEYLFQLQQITTALKNHADRLDLLGFQLAQEITQWLMTASKLDR